MNNNKIMGGYLVFTLCMFLLDLGVGDSFGSKFLSVKDGESVTLTSDVIKHKSDELLWFFKDTLIAHISGDPSKSCLYEGEGGIFRDRLKVDYETGSLKVTNITTEHAGRFEADLIKSLGANESYSKCDGTNIIRKSSNNGDAIKTTTFNVSVSASLSVPDKTSEEWYNIGIEQDCSRKSVLPSLLLASSVGAGVVLLLAAIIVAIFVMCCRYRNSRNRNMKKNKLDDVVKYEAAAGCSSD